MMRVALIGLGMVADTHVAALRDAAEVTLTGVLGRTLERARSFAEKATATLGHPVTVYKDIDDLVADATLDFVILATPPDARAAFVTQLVKHGVPVLMEKPVERTLKAATAIVSEFEKADVACGVVFQNRTRRAAKALKEAIDGGELGGLVAAEIRVPWWREQKYYDVPGRGTYARDGGGVLINQAIHTLDLALWYLGPWKQVQAELHRTAIHEMEAEDWAGAVFRTEAGITGTLMATTAANPGEPESIKINGTDASAELCGGVLTITNTDGAVRQVGQTATAGSGADPMAFTHAWHQRIIEDFAQSIASGAPPLISGREALQAHRIIDAMEQSDKTGRRIYLEQI